MRTTKEIHNPILRLPAARLLAELPPDARHAVKAILMQLRQEAAVKAQTEWRRNKGMTAAYWKAVSIYAGHIARLCRDPAPAREGRKTSNQRGRDAKGGLTGWRLGERLPAARRGVSSHDSPGSE